MLSAVKALTCCSYISENLRFYQRKSEIIYLQSKCNKIKLRPNVGWMHLLLPVMFFFERDKEKLYKIRKYQSVLKKIWVPDCSYCNLYLEFWNYFNTKHTNNLFGIKFRFINYKRSFSFKYLCWFFNCQGEIKYFSAYSLLGIYSAYILK